MPITDNNLINNFLSRRIDNVLPNKEKFKKLLLSGKKLKIYQGFDPSSPNLHIGHLVGLIALKFFQKLGHEVIFLIGDFTGMIGDPTGKSETRTALTHKIVLKNAKTYQDQAGKILDFKSNNPVLIKFNYTWNSKLKFEDILKLSRHLTVKQLIERDMFQTRINENKEIYLNEFLYPLIQGYDSVAMEVDGEVGGSDQMFNMMVGRKLSKEILGKEKFVITTPLLADSHGKKIGKTEGNAINIANPPKQLYGQIMNLSDNAISPCLNLITLLPNEKVKQLENQIQTDPMKIKKRLAWEIVKMLNDKVSANNAQSHFEKTVQNNQVPEDIPEFEINNPISIIDIVTQKNLVPSKSQTRRLVEQNAVKLNGKTISNPYLQISKKNSGETLQIGKRLFIKIK